MAALAAILAVAGVADAATARVVWVALAVGLVASLVPISFGLADLGALSPRTRASRAATVHGGLQFGVAEILLVATIVGYPALREGTGFGVRLGLTLGGVAALTLGGRPAPSPRGSTARATRRRRWSRGRLPAPPSTRQRRGDCPLSLHPQAAPQKSQWLASAPRRDPGPRATSDRVAAVDVAVGPRNRRHPHRASPSVVAPPSP